MRTTVRRFQARTDAGEIVTVIETKTTPEFAPWATGEVQQLRSTFDWKLSDGREVVQDASGDLRILDTGEIIRPIR